VPPRIIIPRRPFPSGSPCVKFTPGVSYHKVVEAGFRGSVFASATAPTVALRNKIGTIENVLRKFMVVYF
jgi:hypothetical protein